MPIPVIGVTAGRISSSNPLPQAAVSEAYLNAVRRAGGAPVILSPTADPEIQAAVLSRVDGLLITGGGDLDPALFNGQPHKRVYGVEPERDSAEFFWVRRAAENGLPFLGICRGIQVINVAFGGTLYTDIADQADNPQKHDYFPGYDRDYLAHSVSIEPGTRLAQILALPEARVNSLHHQGIETAAPGLKINARSLPDNLVEGVELPGHPFGLGVQWHPEWLVDAPEMVRLFRAFVSAAAKE